jgi:hypothetical protein
VSYIDKNSDIVVSARLTDKGRQLLASGGLTFNTFKLGDSEIDYTTLGASYDITLENIIRAKANQPEMKTVLLPLTSSLPTQAGVGLSQVTALELSTVLQAPELGFFTKLTGSTDYSANTTTDYVLQSDTVVPLSGLTGSTEFVPVRQSSTYGSNTTEPKQGDFMLVKMSNDELAFSSQTNTVIEKNLPVPYLWYRVQDTSGTLSANTLSVELDRNFAYFPGYAGPNTCWTAFYPSGTTFSSGGIYSGGTVWNQNNVWSYPMAGVQDGFGTYETFVTYGSENYIGSKEYFGYTSEITSNCEDYRSIGLIHYTNVQTCQNQSEKTYGQKLYIDTTVPASPLVNMPTLMWHNVPFSGSGTADMIGQTFSGTGVEKYVTLSGVTTEVRYYDLGDEYGNIVGRIFPDQQIITVDDQELVAAMSYKSNRNWTLPTLGYGLQTATDGLLGQTQDLYVSYLLESTSGYTTGLHVQNYTCVVLTEEECPDNAKKDVQVTFPTGKLPYMTVSGGTGFEADKFKIIAQRVSTGEKPTSDGWREMDFTSEINNHTTGTTINPTNLENTTFTITKAKYNASSQYLLHNYINIPTTVENGLLQFGDENFFFGTLESAGVTTKWRTKFNIVVPPTQFNTSTNPTWLNSGQNVHISEVGIYSTGGDLVAIGKMNLPIEKNNTTTVIIEIAFDL